MLKQITVPATISSGHKVIAFVEKELALRECPTEAVNQINVAIDEIFSNIAKYAYKDSEGEATLTLEFDDDPRSVTLTFIDSGIPYNPLAKEDPDITLSAEERQIGGLGIYIVKNSMEEVKYRYEDGKNIISLTKMY